jgi:hypothetical protein
MSAQPTTPRTFAIVSGAQSGAERLMLYGPGGIGKSSLAALMPKPVYLDIDNGTNQLDVARVGGLITYEDVRAVLNDPILDAYESVVLDTATRLEALAVAHVVGTIPHEKGTRVTSIEGYSYGKGYQYVYDAFQLVLHDLDARARKGQHVCIIAHACTAEVPNPSGEDWMRYEPRLQTSPKGKASIRETVIEWCDHVLFVDYDVSVSQNGKASGSGTRTIYPYELPTHRAKSRTLADPIAYTKNDNTLWKQLGISQ